MSKPFRFACVGVGQISQQGFLPALKRLENATLAAIVTGDGEKADAWDVPAYDYKSYQKLLESGDIDGVYIGTPVHQHREHAVPALKAKIPVLLEKPMAPSVADCQAIIDAAKETNTPLMVAYRMHHVPFLPTIVEMCRKGRLGEVRSCSASFGHQVNPENHRGQSGFWAGPVADLGIYPLNAIRSVIEEEPIKVYATGKKNEDQDYNFEDTVAVSLLFPSGITAQYTSSYATCAQQSLVVAGSKGSLLSSQAYSWGKKQHNYTLVSDEADEPEHKEFEATDQFGGETKYFIDCVRSGKPIEPNGEEGLMDIRVCEAVKESLETGKEVKLEKMERKTGRIQMDQIVRLEAHEKKPLDEMVNVIPEQG